MQKCTPRSVIPLVSIGAKALAATLNQFQIDHTTEKIYKGLISAKRRPLRFDFYLPKYNALIEFDGKLHFIDGCGLDGYFERVQYHDHLKNEFCKKNNIPLLRIPYTEVDNIEKTVAFFISSLERNVQRLSRKGVHL